MNKKVVLFGSFAGKTATSPGLHVLEILHCNRYTVYHASDYNHRILKLIDMLLLFFKQGLASKVILIDVYSGRAFIYAVILSFLARKFNKKYVCILHGGNLPSYAKAHMQSVQRVLEGACKVIAPSRYLVEKLKWTCDKIEVIPNVIEINSYQYLERRKIQPKIVWMRAFHKLYASKIAIQALFEVKKMHPNALMFMAGPIKDKSYFEGCKEIVKKLNLEESVSFEGNIKKEKICEFINQGDIFLNTPTIDNMPVSVIEAMACGSCIISTDVGGMPYLLKDGHDGLLCPSLDFKSLSNAIIRLLHDSNLCFKLSYNARVKAETFNASLIDPKWNSLIESL